MRTRSGPRRQFLQAAAAATLSTGALSRLHQPAVAAPATGKAPFRLWYNNDTTTCVVADRWGNVVAATPSGWGSKAGPGGTTGITHGTRMISLNNWKGHPNRVEPGKRPSITLTPTLVMKNNKPIVAISVAGGDLQDQTTLNVLLAFIEFGALPEAAVTASRFATGHHVGSFSQQTPKLGSLRVHSGVKKEVTDALAKRGHKISVSRGGIAAPVSRRVLQAMLAGEDAGLMDGPGPKPDATPGTFPGGDLDWSRATSSGVDRRSPNAEPRAHIRPASVYRFAANGEAVADEFEWTPDSGSDIAEVSVPDVRGLDVRAAVSRLHELGLKVEIHSSDEVTDQVPAAYACRPCPHSW